MPLKWKRKKKILEETCITFLDGKQGINIYYSDELVNNNPIQVKLSEYIKTLHTYSRQNHYIIFCFTILSNIKDWDLIIVP